MRRAAAALLAGALTLAAGAQPVAPTADLSGFRWFGELAGACWRGEPQPGTRDTQCYSAQYGRFLRGTIRIETDRDGIVTSFDGDSVFAWDAPRERIVYTQWGANGSVVHSEATWDGDVLRFPVRPRDGGEVVSRLAWKRIDRDSYRVARERRQGNEWREQLAVVYRRVPK